MAFYDTTYFSGMQFCKLLRFMDFPGGLFGKASAYSVEDLGSIPGLGRFPGEEMATHSSILAWRIPWIEESDGL